MLEKVLVANRAEIAMRVIRACRDLGVQSVAVYSEVDRDLRYVGAADEAVGIGPGPPLESYLSIEKIIAAALKTGADAIHPGYGFLAENPEFASAVEKAGLVFIGPPPAAIAALGSKLGTRSTMTEAGVPILPGTDASTDLASAKSEARRIGYPVLVKPSGGGGGRGMRVVHAEEELAEAMEAARREARSSFGDSEVYMEKLLTEAHHIEVQILADTHGSVIHLGDRECSLQRRHQKVVEEGPAPGLTPQQHEEVRTLAVRATRAVGYVGAGTVEFLFDGTDQFYLLEVNTRIQVEHGITEVLTGIDIVAEQIRVASGEPLGVSQDDVVLNGAAIECRVYAEDPSDNFSSSPGRILGARFPGGPWVREDRSYDVGDEVSPYYDGMLAKLVVWGPNRETAIARTQRALSEYRFSGLSTNVGFLRWLTGCEAFRSHRYSTRFIEQEFTRELLPSEPAFEVSAIPTAPQVPLRRSPPPVRSEAHADRAFRAELFVYHRRSGATDCEFLIHVVPLRGGGYQAIPVAPRNQHWAPSEHRRTGWSAEEAVEVLVSEVLSRSNLDEIFPELGMSY